MNLDFDLSKIDGFEWDIGNLEHIKKHGIKIDECEQVFFNKPFVLNQDEIHSQTEDRFRVYGQTDKNRLLTLIFTIRSNKFRVISARAQSKKERREFHKTGGEST
jgi:uncharacterized protein